MTGTRARILHLLKTKGPQTASQLARRLEITAMAVRQHLDKLDELVAYEEERGQVGRPKRVWRVNDQTHFPDSHGELAVGMLAAMRKAFGEEGLERLVAERTKAQIRDYKRRMPPGPLQKRVAALARIRSNEGYMAEWSKRSDGAFMLIENHCPICAAAEFCQGLCAGEKHLFSAVLGPGITIERTEHILSGDRRCAYRIAPRR